MVGSELYFSLFVGIVLSLIFAEKFGINPAGLVVPGYLALAGYVVICAGYQLFNLFYRGTRYQSCRHSLWTQKVRSDDSDRNDSEVLVRFNLSADTV